MKRLLFVATILAGIGGHAFAQGAPQGAATVNNPLLTNALQPSALPAGAAGSIYVPTTSGGTAVATPLASAFATSFGTTVGSILEYTSSGWTTLAPSTTNGYVLSSQGSGQPLAWVANTTGGTGNYSPNATDAETAAGTTQGTAFALPSTYNRITAGTAGTGVIVPAFTVANPPTEVQNDSTTVKYIYPPTGAAFYAQPAGGGAAVALATNYYVQLNPGSHVRIIPYSATTAGVY